MKEEMRRERRSIGLELIIGRHMGSKDFTKALADADQCIKIQSTWAKVKLQKHLKIAQKPRRNFNEKIIGVFQEGHSVGELESPQRGFGHPHRRPQD